MKKIKFEYVRIVIYFITLVFLILLVSGKITTKCFWMDNYNIKCPACGLTRATKSIFTLDFKSAIKYNAVYTCCLVPMVLFFVINDIYVTIKRNIFKKKCISYVQIVLGELSK